MGKLKLVFTIMGLMFLSCVNVTPESSGDNQSGVTITWSKISGDVGFWAPTGQRTIVKNDTIFIFGGTSESRDSLNNRVTSLDVYYSLDGETWHGKNAKSFPNRPGTPVVNYCDRYWALGGSVQGNGQKLGLSHSADGITWTDTVSPWCLQGRSKFSAMIFHDTLFLHGGIGLYSDSYYPSLYSVDGSSYYPDTFKLFQFINLQSHAAVIFKDRIWLLGGLYNNKSSELSAIAYSVNTWNNQAWSGYTFSPRCAHGAVGLGERMWVFGGAYRYFDEGYKYNYLNDAWYSDDGGKWFKARSVNPFEARSGFQYFTYKGKIYVVGGSGNGTKFRDVWVGEISQ